MEYGTREIRKQHKGADVEELQIRLAGFRGTVPDGDFGPGTELQVVAFQRDYMGDPRPSGVVDKATMEAIDDFGKRYPLDFKALKCPCGVCGGFGRGLFPRSYRKERPKVEAFFLYEYPGIHRMLLWALRALMFRMPEHAFSITSGYRCSERNKQRGRSSTNHHGKAVDVDVPLGSGEDKRDDMTRCDRIRGRLVELSNAQIGWGAPNRKSLEPSNIAPTWVHYDVRNYERKYLQDRFFCRNERELRGPGRIRI